MAEYEREQRRGESGRTDPPTNVDCGRDSHGVRRDARPETASTWRRLLVLALVAVLVLPFGTGVVAAQTMGGASGAFVVEEGETVSSIDGVAGSIVVRGTVTGDVSGAAGSVVVADTGRVEGGIEAAAGSVRIDGTVLGDVNAGGGTVEVGETARIGGDLEAGAAYVSVDGTVEGDARVGGETVVLGPNADIGGEFRYDAATFTRDPGASVAGGVVEDPQLGGDVGPTPPVVPGADFLGAVYGLLANLLLGVLLLAVFPAFSTRVATRVADSPATTGGVGLLTLVGVPLVLVVVALTIIGIPVALVGALAFGIAVWVGVVYGQYAVGAWALGRTGNDNRWLALVVGLVGFAVLGAIPFLGGLLDLLALLLGLGALALGVRDAYRARGERRARRRHRRAIEEPTGETGAAGGD